MPLWNVTILLLSACLRIHLGLRTWGQVHHSVSTFMVALKLAIASESTATFFFFKVNSWPEHLSQWIWSRVEICIFHKHLWNGNAGGLPPCSDKCWSGENFLSQMRVASQRQEVGRTTDWRCTCTFWRSTLISCFSCTHLCFLQSFPVYTEGSVIVGWMSELQRPLS